MMRFVICSVLFAFFELIAGSSSFASPDSLLQILDQSIEKREILLKQKQRHIEGLKRQLSATEISNYQVKESYLKQLYLEYRSFHYDSAFCYASYMLENSYKMRVVAKIEASRMQISFILLSSGLFKEALDTMQQVKPEKLTDSLRREYFHLKARILFDMADYAGDRFYAPKYNLLGNHFLDSAILLCQENSIEQLSFLGLKNLREGNFKKARKIYEKLIQMPNIDKQQYAIEASSLSFIYKYDNEPEKSLKMLIKAAIADNESLTKETVAIRQLAEILFNNEDYERAYRYVKIALEDANFYGARHRKVQVSDILPRIEERQLEIVKAQRRAFLIYAVSASFFSVLIIIFIVIIFKQLKTIKKARSYLFEANRKLTEIN